MHNLFLLLKILILVTNQVNNENIQVENDSDDVYLQRYINNMSFDIESPARVLLKCSYKLRFHTCCLHRVI